MTVRSARVWHGITAVVAITALVLQLVLVIQGGRVLDETEQPGLGIRLVGWLSGWYPYPFLDHREEHGTIGVVLTSLAITAFFLALIALARLVDQRAQPAPRAWDPYRGGAIRR